MVTTIHVRNIINPFTMSADVRAALHYLGGEPQVIPNNLGIWGTSMGGALALVAAANDDRVIKALVSQMSPVNHQYNLSAFPKSKMRQVETFKARGVITTFPGPKSRVNPLLSGFPDWVAMKRFYPLSYADKLKAPTLIIDAEQEFLFDTKQNGQLLHQPIKTRLDSRYITYPGKHYDMFQGENLKAARNSTLQWFIKNLNNN
ncbi:MAG: dipeptidyl aminopeptidase/acylaminoacyl peptidase [Psychroserpens sp.]|jgi:dipeptidyl aminopeptidase/acylaminoacyl peptidase